MNLDLRQVHTTLFFFILIIIFLQAVTPPVAAVNMMDDSVILEFEQGEPNPTTQPLREIQEYEPSQITLTTTPVPILRSNPQLRKELSFGITVSSNFIDFGQLSPTNPVIRKHALTLSESTHGSRVFVSLTSELKNKDDVLIPNTTCDDGMCTTDRPSLWENTLTYGFGFRCQNVKKDVCIDPSTNEETYKQLPSLTKGEKPRVVLHNLERSGEQKAEILYKINIPGSQASGNYTSTITYIAAPPY